MKGLSPLVASVLLIAFTVGVGGLISVWISGFTQTQSQIVSKEGEHQILCSNGAIDLSNLKYCNNNISGIIKNNGRITIGNITLQTVFLNGSSMSHALNDTGTGGSSAGNYLALRAGQIFSFNVSIGGDSSARYDKLWTYTNCSTVNDLSISSDVSAC
jgi:flagellin-like protein